MPCPRCQHENPPRAKFCLECGTRLALACPTCGTELPAGAKFCLECRQPVGEPVSAPARFASPDSYTPAHLAERILTTKAAPEGERKQVTVLFADLKGSMELLADRLGMRPLQAHWPVGLGTLSRGKSKPEQAQEHLGAATMLFRAMDMRFWLERTQAELGEPG